MDTSLRGDDPGQWGHSLANAAEIVLPFLDAAGVESVVEVGAYAGDLTSVLLDWAAESGASVVAIDPMPADELVELAERRPELQLVRERSHDALRHLPVTDAAVIDGDHNYYTVAGELRLIAEAAGSGRLPLLIFHDLMWPHGRRDAYYAPDDIPEEGRQPMAKGGHLFPGNPGLAEGGLPYKHPAKTEGGPRNGVLTAVEDFVAERDDVRLAIIPVFFGVGVLWQLDAPYAGALAELADPWDRNPVLARLEGNRVYQLANEHATRIELNQRLARLRERLDHQEYLLRQMLDSRAFTSMDRLVGIGRPGRPHTWRGQIRAALDDGESGGGGAG